MGTMFFGIVLMAAGGFILLAGVAIWIALMLGDQS